MSLQISKNNPADSSITTKRSAWVVYSPSCGFYTGYSDLDIVNRMEFSKVLQEAYVFDHLEAVEDFVRFMQSSLPDLGFLEMKCSI